MATSHLNEYKRASEKQQNIARNAIEAGLVIEFTYKGDNVHTERPLVFVLNPRFQSKLHGIALEHISFRDFKTFYDLIKLKRDAKQDTLIKLRLTKLPIKLSINPKTFYENKVKPLLGGDGIYRTYNFFGISNVKVYAIDINNEPAEFNKEDVF